MIIENFKMAVTSILSNKMRSSLTMLGIVIGIAAVISMLSVGKGAQMSITSSIEKMGTNLLTVRSGLSRTGLVQTDVAQRLNLDDAKALANKVGDLAVVASEASVRGQVKYKGNNSNTSVLGVSPEYFMVRNYEIGSGTFFNEARVDSAAKVCVLGNTVAENLFSGGETPIGEEIRINRLAFKVIGVYKARGNSGWSDEDDQIFIPITTEQKRLSGDDSLRAIYASVVNKKDTDKVEEIIIRTLRRQHKLNGDKENDFTIRSQLELLDTMNNVSRSFTVLLGSIALISLIVGGIGIMNILLVSVTERTREIGIRKAIGAYESDILNQFIIEAVVLCLVGGIIGIFWGVVFAKIISIFSKWPMAISSFSIILAFGVSFATGLFFGYYPARKAAKMNPVDALRYE
ncbi:MAG: ABC transporter permease [Candidatus Margulisiibacteriota bacterium]|nr:MAG: hypothetical protein A2X43_01905 [Candidatus Margulisbacteria bacterium GWD2_39_127]OGI01329.1 MAG: hypothetical protein A2X42_06550 [Candidatus Margulisbacteria bacterium GWF2_38_17]OGI10793.1 MAG: hypothetical protein A2X41_00805 [Candidatus Margulisbacteria bacterium GWE2_39_32]PZM79397.1 MAG: ABC transporter permease [Candidatus Margulisiibacteriota bacterium]HAR63553.1 multidrug ABC transporter substrate-binding protein [Candidatus Margulisiibacteriota bacterium]